MGRRKIASLLNDICPENTNIKNLLTDEELAEIELMHRDIAEKEEKLKKMTARCTHRAISGESDSLQLISNGNPFAKTDNIFRCSICGATFRLLGKQSMQKACADMIDAIESYKVYEPNHELVEKYASLIPLIKEFNERVNMANDKNEELNRLVGSPMFGSFVPPTPYSTPYSSMYHPELYPQYAPAPTAYTQSNTTQTKSTP